MLDASEPAYLVPVAPIVSAALLLYFFAGPGGLPFLPSPSTPNLHVLTSPTKRQLAKNIAFNTK